MVHCVYDSKGLLAMTQPSDQLRVALRQLLQEVIAAGFETATDYNWPKAIADAKAALELTDDGPVTLEGERVQ